MRLKVSGGATVANCRGTADTEVVLRLCFRAQSRSVGSRPAESKEMFILVCSRIAVSGPLERLGGNGQVELAAADSGFRSACTESLPNAGLDSR